MGFQKYAALEVLSAYLVPAQRQGDPPPRILKDAHAHSFRYVPQPGFLYVRSRAISSRTNDNYDTFPADEIKRAWATFIGKPVFVNHHNENHRAARGVVIDAALHEDTNPDGTPDTWVEVLMEVDALKYPKLAKAILLKKIERTSMGTDVKFSICSACGNKASNPLEYCQHIPALKGKWIERRTTASGAKQRVLVHEICHGLGFFENSLLVEPPADPTAFFLGVDAGPGVTASRKTAGVVVTGWDTASLGQLLTGMAEFDAARGQSLAALAMVKTASRREGATYLPMDLTLACGDAVPYISSTRSAEQPQAGDPWDCEQHGDTTIAKVDGPGANYTGLGWDSYHPGRAASLAAIEALADPVGHTFDRRLSITAYQSRDALKALGADEHRTGPWESYEPDPSFADKPRSEWPAHRYAPGTPHEAYTDGFTDGQNGLPASAQGERWPLEEHAKAYLSGHHDGQSAHRVRAAIRSLAYGEIMAPAEVDTLRDESCPICQDTDTFDGDTCKVCGYQAPPKQFQDPDLDKAQQVDLRKNREDEAAPEQLGESGIMQSADGLPLAGVEGR